MKNLFKILLMVTIVIVGNVGNAEAASHVIEKARDLHPDLEVVSVDSYNETDECKDVIHGKRLLFVTDYDGNVYMQDAETVESSTLQSLKENYEELLRINCFEPLSELKKYMDLDFDPDLPDRYNLVALHNKTVTQSNINKKIKDNSLLQNSASNGIYNARGRL